MKSEGNPYNPRYGPEVVREDCVILDCACIVQVTIIIEMHNIYSVQ